ncbi:MAG TPA: hypothetical protein VM840_05020 [Actinomycetota bacterium]|nr:hypothetical protein [Actinomycetota bacterium]
MRLVLLAAIASLVAAFAGWLPRGTDTPALITRGLVGLGAGTLFVLAVGRMMRSLAEPPPPPPPQVEAEEVDVVYVCTVCSTRVRLEVAATGKAPRHCGESMEPMLRAR